MLVHLPRLRSPDKVLVVVVLMVLAWLSITYLGTENEDAPRIFVKLWSDKGPPRRFNWNHAVTEAPKIVPAADADSGESADPEENKPIPVQPKCESKFVSICHEDLVNLTRAELIELDAELSLRELSLQEARTFNAQARERLAAPRDLIAPYKVMLLSGSDYGNQSDPRWNITLESIANREQYADYYGFQNRFVNISAYEHGVEHPVWLKLPLIQETFAKNPEVEWIWWLDSDAMIVNQAIDVRAHVLEPEILRERLTSNRLIANIDDSYRNGTVYPSKNKLSMRDMLFVFSHDRLSINAGSFFVRRSKTTDEILNMWGDQKFIEDTNGDPVFFRREQDAFIYLYFHHKKVRKHTALVAQPLINSYPRFFEDEQAYEPGDFVVHHAGQWNHTTLLRHWNEYRDLSIESLPH